jgi:ATP-dependent Clp protease ATP-binding subunit ClpA
VDGPYFHLYTPQARRAHFFAFKSAIALEHEEVTATDVLRGVLREGRVLFTNKKLAKKKLKEMEEACQTRRGGRIYVSGTLMPYDSESRSILFRAAREMLNRRHGELGLEHLLLALLSVSSPARAILNSHGLTYERESTRMPFLPRTEPAAGDGLDYT